MDSVVTAGGIPVAGDPLYEYSRGKPKAMLDVAGRPMVQWVLDALSASKHIQRIVVVGLAEDSGLSSSKPLYFLPNQGGMLENIFSGAKKVLSMNPDAKIIFSVSSDIPALTGQIVDWMVDQVNQSENDVYYNFISKDAMEKRFPGAARTYTKFKGLEVCGGDLTAFQSAMLTTDGGVWRELIANRKSILKQAAVIGYDTLLLMLFRQLTVEGGVQRVNQRLKMNARALHCPYPEIGMDVDKPHQLELLRRDLAARSPA